MFLKFRYGLGFESLCREVSDSITWRWFCRIALDGAVPHPTTLMKLNSRCGSAAVDGLNEALLAKAAEAEVIAHQPDTCRYHGVARRTWRIQPIRGCWPRRFAGSLRPASGFRPPVAQVAPRCATARGQPGGERTRSQPSCRTRSAAGRGEAQATVQRVTGELAELAAAADQAQLLLHNAKQALRRGRAEDSTSAPLSVVNTTTVLSAMPTSSSLSSICPT